MQLGRPWSGTISRFCHLYSQIRYYKIRIPPACLRDLVRVLHSLFSGGPLTGTSLINGKIPRLLQQQHPRRQSSRGYARGCCHGLGDNPQFSKQSHSLNYNYCVESTKCQVLKSPQWDLFIVHGPVQSQSCQTLSNVKCKVVKSGTQSSVETNCKLSKSVHKTNCQDCILSQCCDSCSYCKHSRATTKERHKARSFLEKNKAY